MVDPDLSCIRVGVIGCRMVWWFGWYPLEVLAYISLAGVQFVLIIVNASIQHWDCVSHPLSKY